MKFILKLLGLRLMKSIDAYLSVLGEKVRYETILVDNDLTEKEIKRELCKIQNENSCSLWIIIQEKPCIKRVKKAKSV